jgi:hypothetical protein
LAKMNLNPIPIDEVTLPAAKRTPVPGPAGRRGGVRRSTQNQTSPKIFRALALLLVLLAPIPNRANPGAVRLHFRTVQSMILVEGQIDGKKVTFLLDTGANHTILSARSYSDGQLPLRHALRGRNSAGMVGESVRLPVNLTLAGHVWASQTVTVMNLDELQDALGLRFDGLLGQDILREFRSVHIDYRDHVIELEQ